MWKRILKSQITLTKQPCFKGIPTSCRSTFTKSKLQTFNMMAYNNLNPACCQLFFKSTISQEKSQYSLHQDKHTIMEAFVNKTPAGVQPYLKLMRIEKPTGTWLLLWPCYWSLSFATAHGCLPDPTLLALFGAGAVLMVAP
nr:4-hydroxybenzoate polyprenyltransferase, mitochondrial-like [Parasteatoda tepidariorum]